MELRLQKRFPDAVKVQIMGQKNPAAALQKKGDDVMVEHGGHFPGRAGEHNGGFAVLLDGTAGGGAVGIGENDGAFRHHGLFFVVLRHVDVELFMKFDDALEGLLVHLEFSPEISGNGLFGQVVVGGAQPPGGDDDVGAGKSEGEAFFEPFRVVAHHRLVVHSNTQIGQFFGKISGVGVDDVAHEDFGSDTEDFRAFGFHD